jgi:cell division GTPase FtsZ
MNNIIFSTKKNSPGNILTIGIGRSSFTAIKCMYDEELEYVDYMQVDPSEPNSNSAFRNIDKDIYNYKLLMLIIFQKDDISVDFIISLNKLTQKTLIKTFMLLIIPENENNKLADCCFDEKISRFGKHINLIVPIKENRKKSFAGKLPNALLYCDSDYLTMWFVKTINSLAFLPGYISTDYADVYQAVKNYAFGFYGMGEFGDSYPEYNRCFEAFNNMLAKDDNMLENISKAKNLMVYIDSSKSDLHADEIIPLINFLHEDLNPDAEFVFNCCNYELQNKVRVTIIGTV